MHFFHKCCCCICALLLRGNIDLKGKLRFLVCTVIPVCKVTSFSSDLSLRCGNIATWLKKESEDKKHKQPYQANFKQTSLKKMKTNGEIISQIVVDCKHPSPFSGCLTGSALTCCTYVFYTSRGRSLSVFTFKQSGCTVCLFTTRNRAELSFSSAEAGTVFSPCVSVYVVS